MEGCSLKTVGGAIFVAQLLSIHLDIFYLCFAQSMPVFNDDISQVWVCKENVLFPINNYSIVQI